MGNDDFLGPIGNASEKYSDSNPVIRLLLQRFLKRLDTELLRLQPTSVLDVGCGEGVVTERFASLLPHASIMGVDADDAVLATDWAVRRQKNLTFQVASGYSLPFRDRTYDVVTAIEVLEHVERPDAVLAEMTRVARRALVVSVPREPAWRIAHFAAGRNIRSFGNTPGHINHWSSAGLAKLVSQNGRIERILRPFPWTAAVVDVSQNSRTGVAIPP
jgi:2-polyprenyl-3-methyl-5-hydroxy-6-metoxy-1,4-benzoquinol methylase